MADDVVYSMEKILYAKKQADFKTISDDGTISSGCFAVDGVNYKVGDNAISKKQNGDLSYVIGDIMTDDTTEIELVTDGTSFDMGESNFPGHNGNAWSTYNSGSESWLEEAITKDLNFTTNLPDADTATTITRSSDEEGWAIWLAGDFTVGKNVTLNINPIHDTYGFVCIGNQNKDLTMQIDGTFINGGGDYALDETKKVYITVSKTGKFLSYSSDNTSFRENSVVEVTGTGTAEQKMTELQFRMGAYGELAGKVNMTGTYAIIGTIADTKLNGDETMTVTNSILTTESEDSTDDVKTYTRVIANKTVILNNCDTTFGKIDLESKSITVKGGSLTVVGTYNFDGGYIIAAGETNISAGAELKLVDAAYTSGAVDNSGTLTMDIASASQAKVESYKGTGGTITVDMTDATAFNYKLIDAKEASDYSGTTVAWTNNASGDSKYVSATKNNDLYAVNTMNVMYYAAADEEADVASYDGYFWGVNVFSKTTTSTCDTLQEVFDAHTDGTRTYTYISNENQILTLNIAKSAGAATVSFGTASDSESYTLASNKTITAEIKAGTAYILSFTGDTAKYDVTATIQKEQVNSTATDTKLSTSAGTASYSTTDNGVVGYCSDSTKSAKKYTFEVASGMSGEYTITITPTAGSDRISYAITNAAGKKFAFGSSTSTVSRTINLAAAGTYTIAVDSYDHGAGKYEAEFSVAIEATINPDVSATDDTYKGATSLTSAGITTKFVGYGDKTDWFKLGGTTAGTLDKSGAYTITVAADDDISGAAIAKGTRVYLYQIDANGKKTLIKSATSGGSAVSIADVMLDKANSYYVQVSASSATSSKYNSTYKVSVTAPATENTGLSSADDAWNGTGVTTLDLSDSTSSILDSTTNWVGTQDVVDYVKLDTSSASGSKCSLTLDIATGGSRVTATLYKQKAGTSGALSSVCTFSANVGSSTKTFACSSDYVYYVRLKSAAGSNVSTNYTATLANA